MMVMGWGSGAPPRRGAGQSPTKKILVIFAVVSEKSPSGLSKFDGVVISNHWTIVVSYLVCGAPSHIVLYLLICSF